MSNPMKHEFNEDLFVRARREIDSRRGSYGGKENSFEFIARRWEVWFKNNFDIDIGLDGHHVASMMVDFKRGRAEARVASSVEPHPDDRVDEAGYLLWSDQLHPLHSREMNYEEIDEAFGEPDDDTVEIDLED